MDASEDTIKTLRAMPREEDRAFFQWQAAQESEKSKWLDQLIPLLQKHAYAVAWLKLKEKRPDVVNESVYQAVSHMENFKGESLFSTWFQAIVQNACNMVLRVRQRQAEVSLDEVPELAVDIDHVEARTDLKRLMVGLKSREKRLINLKLQGFHDDEIADRLGIGKLAVKHMWARTREKMREAAA
jgi:RNA polymerase sigma factor (sigma-70 family)